MLGAALRAFLLWTTASSFYSDKTCSKKRHGACLTERDHAGRCAVYRYLLFALSFGSASGRVCFLRILRIPSDRTARI